MNRNLIAAALTLMTATTASHATVYSRVGDNAAKWETPGTWDVGTGVPDDITDTALFNTNAAGNRNIALESSLTIGLLGIGGANNGNVTLKAAGQTLSVGSTLVDGEIYVSSPSNNANRSGVLTLESGTLSLYGGRFSVATRPDVTTEPRQGNVSATVNIGSTATLNVGTETQRTDWFIARRIATNATPDGANAAIVKSTSTGGTLNAWVDQLVVGSNEGTYTTGAVNDNFSATLALAELGSAMVNANTVHIGVSSNSSAQGTVTVGSHTFVAENAIRLGVGTAIVGTTDGGADTVSGTLTMGEGSHVQFGVDTLNRASANFGTSETSRGPASAAAVTTTRTGSLVATGGTFAGYLSSLTLGSQNAASVVNQTYTATGTLDLRQAQVTAFDVSGNVVIGHGTGEGSHGALRFSDVSGSGAVIGQNLVVGDSKVNSSGLLELGGTLLEVGGDVSINLTGRVTVTVSGDAAGLSLSAGSALTIASLGLDAEDSNAGYFIEFEDPAEAFSGIYAGFAWEGNRLSELAGLIDSHAITWVNHTDFSIGAFYDVGTGTTYIGAIPEPGSILLALTGLGAVAFARRRNLRRR